MLPRICSNGVAHSTRPSFQQSPMHFRAIVLRSMKKSHTRFYAQQLRASTTESTAQLQPQQQQKSRKGASTTPPARTTPSPKSANSFLSTTKSRSSSAEHKFQEIWEKEYMSDLTKTGEMIDIIRMQLGNRSSGESLLTLQKPPLLDLIIPPKPTSFTNIKAILMNNARNVISMNRLAKDFSFSGIMTKWSIHPQIFRCKSVSEKAWVEPFRRDMLDLYKRANRAIATGDMKTLKLVASYDYHDRAVSLAGQLRSRLKSLTQSSAPRDRLHYTWELHSTVSPLRILSLRILPFNFDANEPKTGSRNVVQALARIETMQSLTLRNEKGQSMSVQPDGSILPIEQAAEGEGGRSQSRRVLEYLVFENKLFLTDGWYIRDQMYEGVQPRFKESENI